MPKRTQLRKMKGRKTKLSSKRISLKLNKMKGGTKKRKTSAVKKRRSHKLRGGSTFVLGDCEQIFEELFSKIRVPTPKITPKDIKTIQENKKCNFSKLSEKNKINFYNKLYKLYKKITASASGTVFTLVYDFSKGNRVSFGEINFKTLTPLDHVISELNEITDLDYLINPDDFKITYSGDGHDKNLCEQIFFSLNIFLDIKKIVKRNSKVGENKMRIKNIKIKKSVN